MAHIYLIFSLLGDSEAFFFFLNLSFKKKPAQLAYDAKKKQDTGTPQSRLELRERIIPFSIKIAWGNKVGRE